MLGPLKPGVGKLLLSGPFLSDPNFRRSVVLLVSHDYEKGIIGFVLNQVSEMTIGSLLPELEGCDFKVFTGGPLGLETLSFIHCCHDKLQSGVHIVGDIYVGGDRELMYDLINSGEIREEDVKFFIGYTGWSGEQLDQEMAEEEWFVADQFHRELPFENTRQEMWREVIVDLGPKFAQFVNYPINPRFN